MLWVPFTNVHITSFHTTQAWWFGYIHHGTWSLPKIEERHTVKKGTMEVDKHGLPNKVLAVFELRRLLKWCQGHLAIWLETNGDNEFTNNDPTNIIFVFLYLQLGNNIIRINWGQWMGKKSGWSLLYGEWPSIFGKDYALGRWRELEQRREWRKLMVWCSTCYKHLQVWLCVFFLLLVFCIFLGNMVQNYRFETIDSSYLYVFVNLFNVCFDGYQVWTIKAEFFKCDQWISSNWFHMGQKSWFYDPLFKNYAIVLWGEISIWLPTMWLMLSNAPPAPQTLVFIHQSFLSPALGR